MVLFNAICSYSVYYVHFGFNLSIRSIFVPFGPFVSTSVHLDHLDPFWSTSVHFGALTCSKKKKKKDMFGLRVPIINPNLFLKNIDLKLIISKILSIAFIVATLLLSYINVTF